MNAVVTRTKARAGTHAVLLLFSAVALLPFVSILLISLYPHDQAISGLALPHSLDFGNYADAWTTGNFAALSKSSGIVTACVVPLTSLVSVLNGYVFGTMNFRFKTPLFYLFLIGLVMPFEATIIPLYYDLREFGLANTYPGLILPETALYLSFGTLWMRAHFLTAQRPVIEAAQMEGAGPWTILWRILLPGARPAITTMMALFTVWSWNEFLLALVLAQAPDVQTAPAGLASFVGEHTTDTSGLAAAAVIVTIPVLVVYVLLQRSFIQGIASGGVKG
ncbi:carbohydrate ABC transporter permease [Actinomadura roseirufa]|uniref:carbohydrate ABC transporter permease n=1 Tax=Actinomadura roseirufa TaxID=2094049 RepID=UPI0010414999|nr:carbohydrate ABC transporter permease [Actinomadura roseirufa]